MRGARRLRFRSGVVTVGDVRKTLPERGKQTGDQLPSGLESGNQAGVGESSWPAHSTEGSRETEKIVSEGDSGVEMQPD